MVKLLEWIKENKFYLNKDGKWYSTKDRGNYSQPPKVFTEQELCEHFKCTTTHVDIETS